jgi:hypothetical protein
MPRKESSHGKEGLEGGGGGGREWLLFTEDVGEEEEEEKEKEDVMVVVGELDKETAAGVSSAKENEPFPVHL